MAKGKKTGGRQKGTPNKRTTEIVERAISSGEPMPADMMLELARDAYQRWLTHRDPITGMCLIPTFANAQEGEGAKPERVDVIDWGKRAMGYAAECAPYYHATMKAIEHSGEITTNVDGIERTIKYPEDRDGGGIRAIAASRPI